MKSSLLVIDDCKLKIESFSSKITGVVPETVIDLDALAGEYVHIWVDEDGVYSLDPDRSHYWHIAELQVPPRRHRIDTEEVIQDGRTQNLDIAEGVTQGGRTQIREILVPLPVDLSMTEVTTRELPEPEEDLCL
ncbi:MAG: hypothetical protein NTY86_18310 [Deltaproteobacteria bacterium]|nr:hypothetical protein [Deltaproteobacteria bacterium]